jgi:hypothetical protein
MAEVGSVDWIRRLRGSIFAFVVAIVITVAMSAPAYAAPKWCEADPVIVIKGQWAQVITKFDMSYLTTLTGPLAYDIYVPDFAYAQTVVYLPPSTVERTVNVHALPPGYWPDWSSPDKLKLEVRLYVPARVSFATLSDVTGSIKKDFRVRGASNTLTVFHISLH